MIYVDVIMFIFNELEKSGANGRWYDAKLQLFSVVIDKWTFVRILCITIVILITYKCNFVVCIFYSTFVMTSSRNSWQYESTIELYFGKKEAKSNEVCFYYRGESIDDFTYFGREE